MAQQALRDGNLHSDLSSTLATSYTPSLATPTPDNGLRWQVDGGRQVWHGHGRITWDTNQPDNAGGLGSTGKGILIGMLSAFGSAALVGLVIAIIYFFRYTSRGRIFLDRIGRPGEYDDEQSFLREEEEALAEMDDLQRSEYFRAKGKLSRKSK